MTVIILHIYILYFSIFKLHMYEIDGSTNIIYFIFNMCMQHLYIKVCDFAQGVQFNNFKVCDFGQGVQFNNISIGR